MTTIHANDARDAISRLEMLIGMGAPELPMWFINRQIASAIDIVVQTARIAGGKRKIVQIAEITGFQGETINMHNLFEYVQIGVNESGESEGYFQATGIRPECSDRLARLGCGLSPTSFERGRQDIDRFEAMLAH
jgi:pilus assembly protein CpaF